MQRVRLVKHTEQRAPRVVLKLVRPAQSRVEDKPAPAKSKAQPKKFVCKDLILKGLKPTPGKQMEYWDLVQDGLSILVGYGGTKTFRSRYPLSGKACTRSIGRLGENSTETGNDFSVRAAREQARLDRAIAHEGNDPREVHVRKRTDAFTVRQGVDLFIADMKERNLRSWDQAEKNLNRHLKTWMKKPARSITRPMARDLIDQIKYSGRHTTAERTLGYLKTMWASSRARTNSNMTFSTRSR